MKKWINWINEWLNECTNEWMNEWMDGWMNERTNEWNDWNEIACMHAGSKEEGGREGRREGGRRMAWMNELTEWNGLQLNGKQLNLADIFFSVKFGDALQRTWTGHLTCPKVAPEKSSQKGSCHLAMDALKSNWGVTIECNRPTSPARYEDLWSKFWSLRSHMFPWFGMAPVTGEKQIKSNKQKQE